MKNKSKKAFKVMNRYRGFIFKDLDLNSVLGSNPCLCLDKSFPVCTIGIIIH